MPIELRDVVNIPSTHADIFSEQRYDAAWDEPKFEGRLR